MAELRRTQHVFFTLTLTPTKVVSTRYEEEGRKERGCFRSGWGGELENKAEKTSFSAVTLPSSLFWLDNGHVGWTGGRKK